MKTEVGGTGETTLALVERARKRASTEGEKAARESGLKSRPGGVEGQAGIVEPRRREEKRRARATRSVDEEAVRRRGGGGVTTETEWKAEWMEE